MLLTVVILEIKVAFNQLLTKKYVLSIFEDSQQPVNC